MEKERYNDFIKTVGKEAFDKLKKFDIPPYPKYYQDAFRDLMHGKKYEIYEKLLKNNLYLIEPIKENKEFSLEDNCYQIAKESIRQFNKTNENIKKGSINLNKISKDLEEINNTKLLESFNNFQKELLETLKEADKTIIRLQEEILELEKETNIDPLTKLFNKRALLKDLGNILYHGKDKKLDIFLIIFDIDDFKKINDNYGHIAGDKTLIYLGKLIKNSIREEAKAYRFGGEEFVILLNRVSKDTTLKIAQRILDTVRESKLIYKGNNIRITVSVGIAKHKIGDTVDTIIERADKALYEAKKNGKDRIVFQND